MALIKSKSGILTHGDKKVGTPCGFCPNIIHLHQESGGILHVKSGTPICARCRIMSRSKFARQIQADSSKRKQDVVVRSERKQEVSDKRSEDVAVQSQKNAGGDSDKKKALKHRLNKK